MTKSFNMHAWVLDQSTVAHKGQQLFLKIYRRSFEIRICYLQIRARSVER